MAPQPAERDGKLVAGAVFFAVFAMLAMVGAYVMWPDNLFGTALPDITSAMLLRAAISLSLAFAGLEFLGALLIIALSER